MHDPRENTETDVERERDDAREDVEYPPADDDRPVESGGEVAERPLPDDSDDGRTDVEK